MRTRIEWIDVAKGIGALLVFVGHYFMNESVKIYIYSFHMPLFFFLSGYTFSIKNDMNYSTFLKRKISALMIPVGNFV